MRSKNPLDWQRLRIEYKVIDYIILAFEVLEELRESSAVPSRCIKVYLIIVQYNVKLWKQCTLKPGHQRGLTGKTCNDGSGVNASTGFAVKKCMLFIYFHFQATARINTTDNKKTNTRRSCRSLCFNCSWYFFLKKYRFCKRYSAPHSTGGKNKGYLAMLLMIFSMFTSTYDC